MKTGISRVARAVSLIAVVASLALAPAAFAQSSSVSAYKPNPHNQGGQNVGGNQQGGGGTTEPAVQTTAGGGTLPFTGLDIGFLIGGGILLVAVGAAIARYVPRNDTA
jgi:hypothetical protein